MRKFTFLFCLVLASSFLAADPYTIFSSVTDFDASIKSLVTNPETMDRSKIYLLEGTISAMDLIIPNISQFYAEAQFFSSEWINRRELKSYSIWLVFSKKEFASRIPANSASAEASQDIRVKSRGLALVQYLDTLTLPDGKTAYVFTVHGYRTLGSD